MDRKPVLAFFFALALIAILLPSSFSFNGGNWYYAGFAQNPVENSNSCNFSQSYYLYNALWQPLNGIISLQHFWLALAVIVALAGAFLQFKWVELASKSKSLAFSAAAFSFVFMDLWAPASLAAPRHLAFFILTPLALWLIFSLRENPKHQLKLQILLAFTVFALILTSVLFAFFALLSIGAFYAAIALKAKEIKSQAKSILPILIGILISIPFVLAQVNTLASSTPTPSYSSFESWGNYIAPSLWIPNFAKVFYATGQTFYLAILLITTIAVLAVIALRGWKNDFEAFVLASSLAGILVFFTPVSGLLAKIFLPGVVVEQFMKAIPFYLTASLAIALAPKALPSRPKVAAAIVAIALLAYPAYFYYNTSMNPQPTAQEYLGFEPSQLSGVVLSDFYSAYSIGYAGNAQAAVPNPGYNVCLSAKQLGEISVSNQLYSGTLSPGEAKDLLEQNGITSIVVNPRFWEWRLNTQTSSSGFEYPDSFQNAVSSFRNYGLTETTLGSSTVFKTG